MKKLRGCIAILVVILTFSACGGNSDSDITAANAGIEIQDNTDITTTTAVIDSKYELLDAFSNVEISYQGTVSGTALAEANYIGSDAYIKKYVEFISDADGKSVSNGDVITITAVADFDKLHAAGYDLLERTKTYTVEGLDMRISKELIDVIDFSFLNDYIDNSGVKDWTFKLDRSEFYDAVGFVCWNVGDTHSTDSQKYTITERNIDLEKKYARIISDEDGQETGYIFALYKLNFVSELSNGNPGTLETNAYIGLSLDTVFDTNYDVVSCKILYPQILAADPYDSIDDVVNKFLSDESSQYKVELIELP